jgi:hypothetical protein
MASTFSNLKFELIGSGEQSGVWGTTTNTNIGVAIEQALVGMATLTSADFTTNVATLTLANTNALQNARAFCLNIAAGAVSAAGTVNVPAIQKDYVVINNSSFTVTVKVSGLTGVAVPSGKRTIVYNNGTDVGSAADYFASLVLGAALPVASGGTGLTSGTSGGVLYYSATGTLTSSGALAANALVVGGGAGAAPATVTTGTGVVTALAGNANEATGVITGTGTATLQNKRIDPRVVSTATATTLTPDVATADQYAYTALASGLTINAPTGTPVDGNKLIFRILDNGTTRALTWNATYTVIGVTLPTTTVASKMTYVGCIYNAANTRWDVLAVATQA